MDLSLSYFTGKSSTGTSTGTSTSLTSRIPFATAAIASAAALIGPQLDNIDDGDDAGADADDTADTNNTNNDPNDHNDTADDTLRNHVVDKIIEKVLALSFPSASASASQDKNSKTTNGSSSSVSTQGPDLSFALMASNIRKLYSR